MATQNDLRAVKPIVHAKSVLNASDQDLQIIDKSHNIRNLEEIIEQAKMQETPMISKSPYTPGQGRGTAIGNSLDEGANKS
jgi:hypothetical protein